MSTFTSFPRNSRPSQRKMSTAQTYLVAHTARSKLTREAAKSDHNLRLLVGHANLLDSLMLTLAEQEREQESWFNATVPANASPAPQQHVRWVDSIAEEADAELDSDSEDDSEDEAVPAIPVRARPAPVTNIRVYEDDSSDSEEDSEDELDDEDEDLESLALVRTHSNVMTSPPALVHDLDSDSEDDGPASPPTQVFEQFPAKSQKTTSSQQQSNEIYHEENLFFSPAPVAAY